MQASTITLSVGDLIIDHINGIVGFLVEIENYSEEEHLRIKCWRVFWVGEKVPASEAYQSWTEDVIVDLVTDYAGTLIKRVRHISIEYDEVYVWEIRWFENRDPNLRPADYLEE